MKAVRWIVGSVITFIAWVLIAEFTPSDLTTILVLSLLLAYPIGRYLFLETRKEEWHRARFVGFIGALTAAFVLSTLWGMIYLVMFLGLVESEEALLPVILFLGLLSVLIFAYPVVSFITRQKPTFDASQREAEETGLG